MQCWALSSIPSIPGQFLCSSIYSNMDFLLWRAKERGVQQDLIFVFPWLVWYIWKARNEKVFKGTDVSPMDTIKLAVHEAETWKIAQALEESTEAAEPQLEDLAQAQPRQRQIEDAGGLRCQVDASWGNGASTVGFGFVISKGMDAILFGLGARANTRSPLHAEMEGLIWAMKTMRERGERDMRFESDCAQLIRIIQEDEDWPSIDTELEEFHEVRQFFNKVSFSYVPRTENFRADLLAKAFRHRATPFYHVDRLVPQWLGNHPNLLASA